MFSILQNFTGEFAALAALSGPVHAAYAKAHGYALLSTAVEAPHGLTAQWAKLLCILQWLDTTAPGEQAVWLDGDALIVGLDQPLDGVLWTADLGMVLVEVSNGEYYNNGVMFIRNSTKTKQFFEGVLAAGPFTKQGDGYLGCPYLGDQGRINEMLKASGLLVLDLDCKYNSYILTPCKAPVIKAWHGASLKTTLAEMRKALTPVPIGPVGPV